MSGDTTAVSEAFAALGDETRVAILAGTYDTTVELDPVTLDDECVACASNIIARDEDGELSVTCENDHTLMWTAVPPVAATERTMRDLLSVAARSTYADFERLSAGVCVECHGHLDAEIEAVEEAETVDYVSRTTCDRCGFVTPSAAGVVVLREPAFVAFCHEHGVDVREHLPWTLPVLTDGETTRTSEGPQRYEVRVTADDEVFRATVDGGGDVLATERV